MRGVGPSLGHVSTLDSPAQRELQPSHAELRATAALDLTLHPSEADGLRFEAMRARMLGTNPDGLRLRSPALPARHHPERVARVASLVRRARASDAWGVRGLEEQKAVNAMLGVLVALSGVQSEIESLRRRGQP